MEIYKKTLSFIDFIHYKYLKCIKISIIIKVNLYFTLLNKQDLHQF